MDEKRIEVTGGAYVNREGLTVSVVNGNIIITGWYDGGCPLEIAIFMSVDEFIEKVNSES